MICKTNMINETQSKLIKCLSINGKMLRSEIVEYTDIPRTTTYDNLSELIGMGLVIKFPKRTVKQGRPKIFFQLKNPFYLHKI